ncbi:MAG: phosphate ABC transporter substrate-binding protein [Thermoanaerobaculia bacterium]|nr:phosphate ABC transporter substrate-binding protein [Thermoanaerobaculia bacterium]
MFGLCVFAGCGSSNEPSSREGREGTDPARLVVTGSSTIAPLISDVARRYEQEHPGVRIDVQTGGSSRGLTDARRGLADVGMVSRSPREGEDDVAWIPIALDGLAIIVHADSPVNVLSEEQVVAIYRGEIETWRDVGGEDAPITVVTKADGRSTLEVFLDHFGLTAQEIRADVVIGDNQQAIKTVVGNPDAIAYVSIGTAEYEAMQGAPLRLLRLGDFEPSTDAVRAGSYPVARTLHVVAKGESAPVVSEFLDFLLSPAVHDLVESHFFVPLDGPTPDGPAG